MIKLVSVAVLISLASGFPNALPDSPPQYQPEPPVYGPPPPHKYEEEPKKPYAFDYGVKDEYSGAVYNHAENSDGNSVKGSYVVVLPDGRIQTVNYVADHHNGFQAQVEYEGEAQYPETKLYQHQPSYSAPQPSYPAPQPSYPAPPPPPPPSYPEEPPPPAYPFEAPPPPPPSYPEEEALPPVYIK